MRLVVITGCLGFIGSYITRTCLENKWKVLGIDKCTYAANKDLLVEFNINENFTFLKEDICNLKFLTCAFLSLAGLMQFTVKPGGLEFRFYCHSRDMFINVVKQIHFEIGPGQIGLCAT